MRNKKAENYVKLFQDEKQKLSIRPQRYGPSLWLKLNSLKAAEPVKPQQFLFLI